MTAEIIPMDTDRDRCTALARTIYDEIPLVPGRNRLVPADVLALLVLLQAGGCAVHEIQAAFSLSVAGAVGLTERAEAAGYVARSRPWAARGGKRKRTDGGDARVTIASLTAKGQLMRTSRRGNRP